MECIRRKNPKGVPNAGIKGHFVVSTQCDHDTIFGFVEVFCKVYFFELVFGPLELMRVFSLIVENIYGFLPQNEKILLVKEQYRFLFQNCFWLEKKTLCEVKAPFQHYDVVSKEKNRTLKLVL